MVSHSSRIAVITLAVLLAMSGSAEAGLFRHRSSESSDSENVKNETTLTYESRTIYVHVPQSLPAQGQRPLVVVLHGGMGNAKRIATEQSEKGMNLDEVADKYGFIVAYMNGTAVTRFLGDDKKGWNAGLCCGQSSEKNIDDVSYITGAVKYLAGEYGVDMRRVYGVGHSNGAMMTQRMICETGLFSAGVSISGGLNMEVSSCPGARGRSILELHGEKDTAVPLEGGKGSGISNKYDKKSQEFSKRIIEGSGGSYKLEVLPGAAHKLDTISEAVQKQDGISLPEKIVRFFGLSR